jgi:tetratricopeptide (TPR) repeat protein
MSMALSVLGFVALSLDNYQAAHLYYTRISDAGLAAGFGEPGVLKFLPDEIEALVALGEIDEARSLMSQLEAQGRWLQRSWALATAARCRARLDAMDGDLEGARSACDQALAEHARLPMPFELGRTLLVRGMIERRAKQKSAARQALSQALDIFEHLGAPLWAGKARRELSKIAVRASVDGLTETAPCRGPGGSGPDEPGDRLSDVRDGEHRADPRPARLPEAGFAIAHGTGGAIPLRAARCGMGFAAFPGIRSAPIPVVRRVLAGRVPPISKVTD